MSNGPVAPIRIDVDPTRVPMTLAALHRRLETGTVVELVLTARWSWDEQRLADVIIGAGFESVGNSRSETTGTAVRARRRLTLPDTVGPDMRLLVCGLNPSIHAAEMGIAFGRPGNRFWPAALAAGLVRFDRDPDHALAEHGIGMTDLVKRATRRAAEIEAAEYEEGLARLDRLVRWLAPSGVCLVGLAGWRAVSDRGATAGPQTRSIGDRPVYLMPSTSGLNAHSRLEHLADHLRSAAEIGDRIPGGRG